MQPQPLTPNHLSQIRLIATDMDGTLTIAEKFTPHLLQAFDQLRQAQIPIIIVTGRSAGWVSAIAHYLPITGAICENGGIFYQGEQTKMLVPIADIPTHRQSLAKMFTQLQHQFPQIQASSDNQFRLTDWTFDVKGLSRDALQIMAQACQQQGWGFTYSTVQCHIKLPNQEKALGLKQVLAQLYPELESHQIVTLGDSPNDVTLFDRAHFPCSVGVANVANYLDQMAHHPLCITASAAGSGFCELVSALLAAVSIR
jgi:HAD superfamily hydrolase (TIGR01484 family)